MRSVVVAVRTGCGAYNMWCVQRTLLWGMTFFNRKSFGVLRTPSRRGRVRCTHQHQGKSNGITWSFFHTRFFHTAALPIHWCARRTLLWGMTFFNRKSFGVLRTPSRRGRVRCTHQHQGKSNGITWRFFHTRFFRTEKCGLRQMPLQPELQQCQVPQLAALDPGQVPLRGLQQLVDITSPVQAALAAGL